MEKILTWEALKKEVERNRAEGKKIAFTNGCFDILHAGHVQYLREARKIGDLLILGLNSDRSVRAIKGKSGRWFLRGNGRGRRFPDGGRLRDLFSTKRRRFGSSNALNRTASSKEETGKKNGCGRGFGPVLGRKGCYRSPDRRDLHDEYRGKILCVYGTI